MSNHVAGTNPSSDPHMIMFNSNGLAKRWQLSPGTLSWWRWSGRGPKFIKLGGKVLYRLSDIEDFENQNVFQNTIYTK